MDAPPEVNFEGPTPNKKRGRPPKVTVEMRAEGIRQERRKVRGANVSNGIKLATNEDVLDRNTFHYRFANDVGNRVRQLEADDYDVVRDDQPSPNAGVADNGKPFNAVLMRKRKDWHEQDQADKQKRIDSTEDDMRRGSIAGTEIAAKGGAYTPDQNTIERV